MPPPVCVGDLREYLRSYIWDLRQQRKTKAVRHELRVACEAFVRVTDVTYPPNLRVVRGKRKVA